MKRSKINEIENWYNSSNRKPLMVWGARQVGKTTLSPILAMALVMCERQVLQQVTETLPEKATS